MCESVISLPTSDEYDTCTRSGSDAAETAWRVTPGSHASFCEWLRPVDVGVSHNQYHMWARYDSDRGGEDRILILFATFDHSGGLDNARELT